MGTMKPETATELMPRPAVSDMSEAFVETPTAHSPRPIKFEKSDPSFEVTKPSDTTIQVGQAGESLGSSATPSWWSGEEDTKEWNEYLHHLQVENKRWTWLIVAVAWPSVLVFSVPVFVFIGSGKWWSVSTGSWYGDGPFPLPSILVNHFFLASFMLVLLIVQVVLAFFLRPNPKTTKQKNTHKAHRYCGYLATAFTLSASILGTIALGFCDIQPKRGSELLFFCLIGVCIYVSCVRGVGWAGKKKFGLHFQYMFYTIVLVTSPGWNRITTISIRLAYGGLKAFTDEQFKDCFYRYMWDKKAYHYAWSFFVGECWVIFWWLFPYSPVRAPFFKKFSVGFWMVAIQTCLLAVTMMAMFHKGAWVPNHVMKCTQEEIYGFHNWTMAVKAQGLQTINEAYGLCSPYDGDEMQGISSMFLSNPLAVTADRVSQFWKQQVEQEIKEDIRNEWISHQEGLKLDCVLSDAGVELNQTLLKLYFPLGFENLNVTDIDCDELLNKTQHDHEEHFF